MCNFTYHMAEYFNFVKGPLMAIYIRSWLFSQTFVWFIQKNFFVQLLICCDYCRTIWFLSQPKHHPFCKSCFSTSFGNFYPLLKWRKISLRKFYYIEKEGVFYMALLNKKYQQWCIDEYIIIDVSVCNKASPNTCLLTFFS